MPQDELQRRLEKRPNHFMTSEMLESQLAAFEPLWVDENAIILDGRLDIPAILQTLLTEARQRFPNLNKPWWERR